MTSAASWKRFDDGWFLEVRYVLFVTYWPRAEAELATLARHQPTYRVERLLDAPTGSRFVIMIAFIFGRA
jgi:hypothetical protein